VRHVPAVRDTGPDALLAPLPEPRIDREDVFLLDLVGLVEERRPELRAEPPLRII
jgi:hypothetical protein